MQKNILKSKTNIFIRLALVVMLAFVGAKYVELSSNNVFADNPTTTLTVSPMSQKLILTPGETYEGDIKVVNSINSTENMSYEASIGSYQPNNSGDGADDYSGFSVTDKSSYNIIAEWATLSKNEGTVEPNGVDTLTYTIKVPKNAPAGAQYFSILVTEKDKSSSNTGSGNVNSSIRSRYQLASIVYANVAGETTEKGSVTENNMPSILTNSKLEATSMVRNEGNIYTDATYTLQVWPLFNDEELCTNEEKAETSMILPETERYHVQTCNLPAIGIFRAKQVVKIFGEESTLEKTIIVCPVWLMILTLAVIIAIIVIIVITVKKHKKHSDDED